MLVLTAVDDVEPRELEDRKMTLTRVLPFVVVMAVFSAVPADAQYTKNWKDWYGEVSGGFTMTQGDASDVIDNGWNLRGGATYYPDDWVFGVKLGLEYNDFDITREVLDAFESSGGYADIWGVTGGLTWSPRLEGGIGFGLSAGVGGYHLTGRLTEPGVACGPICPPWSWWCYPGCLPGTIVTNSVSTTKFGYNLGLEITFEVGQGSMIYVEARYTRIETDTATELFPISVGYRW